MSTTMTVLYRDRAVARRSALAEHNYSQACEILGEDSPCYPADWVRMHVEESGWLPEISVEDAYLEKQVEIIYGWDSFIDDEGL